MRLWWMCGLIGACASAVWADGNIGLNFVGGGSLWGTPSSMSSWESAGVVSQTHWNNAYGEAGTLLNLATGLGESSGISVSWQAGDGGTWSTSIPDSAGNNRLMKGYLDTSNTGTTTVDFSGLFFDSYDVYIYHDGDNVVGGSAATRTAHVTLSSPTSATITFGMTDDASPVNFNGSYTLGETYTKYSGLQSDSFSISTRPFSSSDGVLRAPLNGIQIVGFGSDPFIPPDEAPAPVTFASPDGSVQATISVDESWQLQYSLVRDGRVVLENSPLGVSIDREDLGSRVIDLAGSQATEVQRSYQTRGVHVQAEDHYNAHTLTVSRDGDDASLEMEFRLYDDGLAYRYVIPGSGGRTVDEERSGFAIPAGSTVYYQGNTSNYEGTVGSAEFDGINLTMGPPATFALADGSYVAITESNVDNYCGMTLNTAAGTNTVRARFSDDQQWTVPAGSTSPWRLVMTSDDLNGLVNSDLVTNTAADPDPQLFADTSYIRPGRAVWSWWDRNDQGATGGDYDKQFEYVDYARQLGFEYNLVDDGWEGWSDKWNRLEDLVDYGRQDAANPVDIWVWKYWGALTDATARRAWLDDVAAAGAVGVKVDFMDSESQAMMNFYEDVLRDAAARGLMVNFHGANKPAGESRTYPNEMTREGVRGLEYNSMGAFLTPEHNVLLPFTRLLAGHADYTPVTFNPERMGDTTVAHQLATAVVMTSPVTHWADHPSWYINSAALDVIKAMPPAWDETVVLDATTLGDTAAFARRSGDMWFIGVLNDATERTLTLDLDCLGGQGYRAVWLSDTPGLAAQFTRADDVLLCGTSEIQQWFASGGGLVAMLQPLDAGDINGDGMIDDADYTIWADNYGQVDCGWFAGDLNGDGLVDDADYTVWADHYGQAGLTPEPNSLALLLIAAGAMLKKKR